MIAKEGMAFNSQEGAMLMNKVTYIHGCLFFFFNVCTIDDGLQGCLVSGNDDDMWDNEVQHREHLAIVVNEKHQCSLVSPWYLEPPRGLQQILQ